MLTGTADVERLARSAPRLERYLAEPMVLEDVALFQLVLEMRNGAREAVLPPSLHPTVPPTLSLQVWDVADSPWGPFRMAVSRVSCRAGVRARGFTTAAVVSSAPACDGLRGALGYPARTGEIAFVHGYSGVEATVRIGDGCALRCHAIDPEPIGADDAQYTGTLNLAQAPAGLRLLQVEFDVVPDRAERLRARLEAFDAAAWGEPLLDPYFVVAASLARGRVTFAPLRFALRVDELAFTGTESIAGQG
ncbi:MAG: hypothetical protein R3E86_04020 [Pseudomonadales bacterium]